MPPSSKEFLLSHEATPKLRPWAVPEGWCPLSPAHGRGRGCELRALCGEGRQVGGAGCRQRDCAGFGACPIEDGGPGRIPGSFSQNSCCAQKFRDLGTAMWDTGTGARDVAGEARAIFPGWGPHSGKAVGIEMTGGLDTRDF